MTLNDINEIINRKINENEKIIKFTFYDLRVRENLTEEEMYNFLYFAETRLKNLNYSVYKTGQKYQYEYKEEIVKNNEMLIALKKVT